jgi:hypothetical protein
VLAEILVERAIGVAGRYRPDLIVDGRLGAIELALDAAVASQVTTFGERSPKQSYRAILRRL